jgi:hypothetical protein
MPVRAHYRFEARVILPAARLPLVLGDRSHSSKDETRRLLPRQAAILSEPDEGYDCSRLNAAGRSVPVARRAGLGGGLLPVGDRSGSVSY